MSLVVVLVIVGLACVWYFTADDEGEEGLLGPLVQDKADPGTTNFIPRPDWFFYFLFYLLRIFKWPASVVLGTVIVPTILLILLIGLPFYDRGRERHPARRPVAMIAAVLVVLSMGVLTWKGATAEEALGSELSRGRAAGVGRGAGIHGERGGRGRCHAVRADRLPAVPHVPRCRAGLGAPDLRCRVGQGRAVLRQYLTNPAEFGNTVMGSYAYLGEENLRKLAAFLAASDGG